VYDEAKFGVLREEICRDNVDGVWKERRASDVAVREE
jgi:hypothetical protein